MLTLAAVRDYLKALDIAEHYYIGKLDNAKEKSLGVYELKNNAPPVVAIGGEQNSTYRVRSVSLLLHWNKNANSTERAAHVLYNALKSCKRIGNTAVYFIRFLQADPIDIGTDHTGVYERVIEIQIYYERT